MLCFSATRELDDELSADMPEEVSDRKTEQLPLHTSTHLALSSASLNDTLMKIT